MKSLEGLQNIGVSRLRSTRQTASLIRLFEKIAQEEGWQPEDALRSDAHRSVYFAGRVNGHLAGGLQLILADKAQGLPSQRVWPEARVGEGSGVAHVAILALLPEYRGRSGLFAVLCVELWRYCQAHGIYELWLEATPPTLKVYRRLGWPLEVIGDLRRHWGEDCYLCRMSVLEVEAALRDKAAQSQTCRSLVRLADGDAPPELAGALG